MAVQPLPAEFTTFSMDVLGRYVCNRLEEASGGQFAANSARPADRPDARQFDVIVVGHPGERHLGHRIELGTDVSRQRLQ